jgi:hypothetical protein
MMVLVLMLEDLATVAARAFLVQPALLARLFGLPGAKGAYLMAL